VRVHGRQIPTLVRAGAVLAEFPSTDKAVIGRASRQYTALSLSVFLGGADGGSTSIYEDDGGTTAYTGGSAQQGRSLHRPQQLLSMALLESAADFLRPTTGGASSFTRADWAYAASSASVTVTVGAAEGSGFPALPASRAYEIRLVNAPPPSSVSVAGRAAKPMRKAASAAAAAALPTWYVGILTSPKSSTYSYLSEQGL
jgi:hypothetical protein